MSEIRYPMTQEEINQRRAQVEDEFEKYLESLKKDGKCDDCGKQGKVWEQTGCGDGEDWCDLAEGKCCIKDVCVDGCEYPCEKCGNMVKANRCAGWHFPVKCDCGHVFETEFSWFGPTPITNYQRGWLPSYREAVLREHYTENDLEKL